MTKADVFAIKRQLPLLGREWAVEAALCVTFSALVVLLSPALQREPWPSWQESAVISLIGPAMTMTTRFILHIPWMICWRYLVAARRGFRLIWCLSMVAASYVLAYLAGIVLSGGALLIVLIASLDRLVFPSFAAALLAPAVLYWMQGEIFDSAVAKAAKAERATVHNAD